MEFDDDVWNDISIEIKDLITKMLSKEHDRPTASRCLQHEWFSRDHTSLAKISSKSLGRMKQFSHVVNLKKAILMFIAYRSNNREEIMKSRKIFLSIDSRKHGYVSYDDIHSLLESHLDNATIQSICESIDVD